MALLLSQSWGYSTAIADFLSGNELTIATSTTIGTAGPLGDNYLLFQPSGPGQVWQNWPSSPTTFFWGCRIQLGGTPSSAFNIAFSSPAGNAQITVVFNTLTGLIQAFRGTSGGTLLGSSAVSSIPHDAWVFVEIGGKIDTSTGTLTVKVGAGPGNQTVTVLNLSGINTQADVSFASVGSVQWGCTAFQAFYISHEYLCDSTGSAPNNSFLGDVRVVALNPVSDDAVTFTPNGLGANWQNAALVPPVPLTDFNSSPTLNNQDTYVVAALPASLGVIYGVTTVAAMYKSDAGGRSMASVLKSGSTAQVNANIAVATSPLVNRIVSALDPATTAAWLASNMTAGKLKVGVKVTV